MKISMRAKTLKRQGQVCLVQFLRNLSSIFVSPAKQKRDICTAFPASSLSSSLSSSSAAAA